MKSLSALTVPLVITFAFLSAANAAEDRPNTTLVQKAKTSAVASTATKAAKAPTSTSVSNTVKTGAKQGAPMAGQAAPASERAYEGCQGKGSDA